MVNAALTPGTGEARDAERRLATGYAPAATRAGVEALLALDAALAAILRTTREPLVGQMRLTWWHDALGALDTAPPPAEPVLRALAADVLPRGVTGRSLAAMTDGWIGLLAEPADLALFGTARGGGLFGALAAVLGARDDPARVAAAGQGWALADLAGHMRDPAASRAAEAMSSVAMARAEGGRWSRAGRMLAAFAWLAADDLRPDAVPGSPRRVARLAWLRLTGR